MIVKKFDELLSHLGTGRWNLIYFLNAAYWSLIGQPQALNAVFLAPPLNYTCHILPHVNITVVTQDSCSYLRRNSAGLEVEEPCTEWDFDTSVFSSTLTSEFGLVCGRAYLRATYQSLCSFAAIFGSLVLGYVSDRFGRKVVLIITTIGATISSIGTSFLNSFPVILVFRFIVGFMSTPTSYLLALEVCELKHRTSVGILMGLPRALGVMMWGGTAYFIRDWQWLQLAVSLPMLPLCFTLCLVDESPRWLTVRGHHQWALQVLTRAARLNKVTLPPEDDLRDLMTVIQQESCSGDASRQGDTQQQPSYGAIPMAGLLRTPKMRLVTAMICIISFIMSFVFMGLSLGGSLFNVDPFLYMIIGGLMEVPGYTITVPLIQRYGRKIPLIVGFFICGVSVLSLTFTPADISWLVLTLAMLGKLIISGIKMIMVMYQAELQPTEVRMQGKSVMRVGTKSATSIAPYITDYLNLEVPWLPSVLFGALSILACLALVPLPETQGANLPDTMADLDTLWLAR